MAQVSIHVVTYNSAETIEFCLKSALAQKNADFSILVIDNASTDDTVERARGLGIPVIENKENVGYAVAHNQAIDSTSSDYVLTLNPDVWLDPDYVAEMVKALESDEQLGSAAGCLYRVEKLGDAPQFLDSTGLFMRRSRRQYLRDDGVPVGQHTTKTTPIFGPDGAAAFYRRAMLDDIRVNGEVFDADFFMHKEDVDVCWRAQLRGWKSVYVPEAAAHHIRGFRPGQRERVSQRMRFLGVRNRYLLLMKNEIPAHFVRDLWAILPYDLAIIGYIVLRERQSLAALVSAWKLWQKMMQKRKIIHAKRKVSRKEIQGQFREIST